jgi:hypothetical protein
MIDGNTIKASQIKFKKNLNSEIYEKLPLNMCISIKVSRNDLKTAFAHIQ